MSNHMFPCSFCTGGLVCVDDEELTIMHTAPSCSGFETHVEQLLETATIAYDKVIGEEFTAARYVATLEAVIEAVRDWRRDNGGRLVLWLETEGLTLPTCFALQHAIDLFAQNDVARELGAFVLARQPSATWAMLRDAMELLFPHSGHVSAEGDN